MMAKTPGLTAILAITLALGIGASTTIFSVVSSIVLRDLPYEQPNRTVRVYSEFHSASPLHKFLALDPRDRRDPAERTVVLARGGMGAGHRTDLRRRTADSVASRLRDAPAPAAARCPAAARTLVRCQRRCVDAADSRSARRRARGRGDRLRRVATRIRRRSEHHRQEDPARRVARDDRRRDAARLRVRRHGSVGPGEARLLDRAPRQSRRQRAVSARTRHLARCIPGRASRSRSASARATPSSFTR